MATKNPYQGDDYDFFEAARDPETGEIKREMPKAEPKAEAPKKQTFSQAFAAARRAGDKTFTFNGKSFSTKMASDAKSNAPTVATSRGAATTLGRVGPTKERAAAMPLAKKEEAKPAAKTAPAKTEMQRNTASNVAANRERLEARAAANRERMEAQRKARSSESKPLFGRNPAGKTPAEFRKEQGFAKGGTVSARADGIAKRGKTKCKII